MELSGEIKLTVQTKVSVGIEKIKALFGENQLLGAKLELILGDGSIHKINVVDIDEANWTSFIEEEDEEDNKKTAKQPLDDLEIS